MADQLDCLRPAGVSVLYAKTYTGSDDPVSGETVSLSGYTNLGWVKEDGVTITPTYSTQDVKPLGVLGAVKRFGTDEMVEVAATLLQTTVANLSKLLGGLSYTAGEGTAPSTVGFGDGAIAAPELAIVIDGENEDGERMVWFLPKANPGESLAMVIKNVSDGVPITFRSLNDTSRSAGERQMKIWSFPA